MIDASKIQKVRWHRFELSAPDLYNFIDCWVDYYNGNKYHFRYHHRPPAGVPSQLYRLGFPYDFLLKFGVSGELPYEFYTEFVYQCNNWYQYTLINFSSNYDGKEDKNRASEGSQRSGSQSQTELDHV